MPPLHRSRKSPGAQPLTAQRDQYLALMRQGMSNAAASRVVGVNRKTGHRWRYGRSVTTRTGEVRTYAAITGPAHPVAARFLSEAERISIADGLIRGLSIRAIAVDLGRVPSTISREIRRNRDAEAGAYHPYRAQRRAAGRRIPPSAGETRVESRAPEGRCRPPRAPLEPRADQPAAAEPLSCPAGDACGARDDLPGALRTRAGPPAPGGRAPAPQGRVHRKRRRRSGQRLGRFVAPMVMLAQRPADVADRVVAGHSRRRSDHGQRQSLGHRDARRAHGSLPRAAASAGRSWRRAGPRRPRRRGGGAAGPPATLADLGPGGRDEPPRRVHPNLGRAGLLLRTCQPMAARHEREYQRPAPLVLPQGHSSAHSHRRRPGQRGGRAEHPTPQDPRLGDPFPAAR